MIFQFPDLETLRIALTSGQVPSDVSLAAAEVSFDAEGRPAVKPHSIPPKSMQNALKRLGIKAGKEHYGEPHNVAAWPEIVPLVREPGTPDLAPTAPVLFEMPAKLLTPVVTEMLRLGNDRQSFRCLANGDAENQRILLRVIGPPYYTLLRALDHLNAEIAAYIEKAPRVWIEIGHTHPLAGQLTVPEGKVLLLRPPNRWTNIEDGPFQDIYSILDFRLSSAPVDYAEAKLRGKLTVPLKLAPGNAADQPEMWVLRQRAMEVFDEFVRDADSRLMNRLMFAIAQNGEAGPTVILRTRPSKLPPPALEIEGAHGYIPFRRLSNLFLPAGTRLHPTLRRDVVRKMLADDPAQIVWLAPLDEGRFAPQTLPDEAFLPLEDWIDYVIDHERQALQTWVQATQFDFDSFICKGDLPDDAPRPPASGKKERKGGEKPKGPVSGDDALEPPETKKSRKKGQPTPEENAFGPAAVSEAPNILKIRREELEKEFLAVDGPLEAPERLALWPQLAAVNVGLGYHAEAAICWMNGLWESPNLPDEWLWSWMKSEDKDAQRDTAEADFDRFLEMKHVTATDVRRLAVLLLWAGTRKPISAALKKRLPDLRRFVEAHDHLLGIRFTWLLWLNLAKISGDVLGLAHVRDRVVERLLKSGLKKGYDVAEVIYSAGHSDTTRVRAVQEHLLKLRGQIHEWLRRQDDSKNVLHQSVAPNGCYVDLMIAFGLAKTGDERHCKEFSQAALSKLRSAKDTSANANKASLVLADAFEFRIHQAANGQPHGSLSTQILEKIAGLDGPSKYAFDKLKEHSLILELTEKSDAYIAYKLRHDSALNKELEALQRIVDVKKLQSEIRRILAKPLSKSDRITALKETVPLTSRIGEVFASEVFAQVLPALSPHWANSGPNPPVFQDLEMHARLVAVAAPLAANYGWTERVQQVLERFVANLQLLDEMNLVSSINYAALGTWLRALRKCGLKDQIQSLLTELTDLLVKGRSLRQLQHDYSRDENRKDWVNVLRSLLHLTEFWVYFGWDDQAAPFIKEARLFLFDKKGKSSRDRPAANNYASLVNTYIRAVGQNADVDLVASNFSELLEKMDAIPNMTTVSSYYSPLHLGIVDSMVLSLVSEDFILGETARRWLDDDEYLIRRRIHGDMRKHLNQSGL